jgi:hypothetical protein
MAATATLRFSGDVGYHCGVGRCGGIRYLQTRVPLPPLRRDRDGWQGLLFFYPFSSAAGPLREAH